MLAKLLPAPFLIILWSWPFLYSSLWEESGIVRIISYIFLASGVLNLVLLNRTSVLKNPSLSALSLFLSAILISIASSGNFGTGLPELYKYLCVLTAFLTVSYAGPRVRELLPLLLTTCCFAVCLFALYWGLLVMPDTLTFLERHHLTRLPAYEYLLRGRFFVPLLTPSSLGSFIILLFPLGVAQLFSGYRPASLVSKRIHPGNILRLAFVMTAPLVLLATQSLGALLGLFFSFLVFWLTRKKPPAKILILLLVILLVFVYVFYSRIAVHRTINSPVFSVTQRFAYWEQTFSHIIDHPFLGNGPGTFPDLMRCAPHNSFLQLWGETGLLGLLPFLFICGKTVVSRFSRPGGRDNDLTNGLWIGNLAFLIHNLFDSNLFDFQVSVVWWVVAALLLNPEKK